MTDPSSPTCEEFFFERIAAADPTPEDYREFFELLWQTHSRRVFQEAYVRLRQREDAQDICQEAFLRAMLFIQRRPKHVPPKTNFSAWLRVITRNACCDRLRKGKARRHREAASDVEDLPVTAPPEKDAVLAEDLVILQECIEQLTDRVREVLLLHELKGLTAKAIAVELGSNTNAVCVALHRARRTLRRCVEQNSYVERKQA